MRTGIFFYYQKGERLQDFPQALEGILEKENVFFYDALYPSKFLLLLIWSLFPLNPFYQVHSSEMVEEVRRNRNF